MPRTSRWSLAALLAASTLLAGCGPSPSGPEDHASPTIAAQWFAARASAQRQGVENLVSFYDPDLVLDHRALGADPITGRAEALEHLNTAWHPRFGHRTQSAPLYLSADTALSTETVVRGLQSRQIDAAIHTTMGPSGAVSETIAASLASWRTHDPGDDRTTTAQALAQQYTQAWSQEDAEAIRVLYQTDALVTDSMAGITARGTKQIVDVADSPATAGGLAAAVIDQLPDYRGLAVFAAGRPLDEVPFDTIALLMIVGAEDSCPHRVATVLHLGPDGLIQAEERLHRIDDLQRCRGTLPPGWWASAVVPDPVLVERTGTLTVGDLQIEVYNGTTGLESLITWSFAQFRAHDLGTPTVRRVTFHDNQIDKCEGVTGLILGDAVTLCFDSAAACMQPECTAWQIWARKTALHELAHAWMDEHLDAQAIEQFQTATGMPTWSDPEQPWGRRGVELAAETIAWATVDDPVQVNPKLGPHACDELTQHYEILTGRPPEPTPPGCEPTPPD